MIEITNVTDEVAFAQYVQARNAPRDTIRFGVRPNAVKALHEYQELLALLNGGMAGFAAYHAQTTAAVAPFITLMQAAMKILIDTPALINQAAKQQGATIPPFGAEINEPINPADYAALLASTVAAVQAVAAALQGGQQ